jgi:hypothetical protein
MMLPLYCTLSTRDARINQLGCWQCLLFLFKTTLLHCLFISVAVWYDGGGILYRICEYCRSALSLRENRAHQRYLETTIDVGVSMLFLVISVHFSLKGTVTLGPGAPV